MEILSLSRGYMASVSLQGLAGILGMPKWHCGSLKGIRTGEAFGSSGAQLTSPGQVKQSCRAVMQISREFCHRLGSPGAFERHVTGSPGQRGFCERIDPLRVTYKSGILSCTLCGNLIKTLS